MGLELTKESIETILNVHNPQIQTCINGKIPFEFLLVLHHRLRLPVEDLPVILDHVLDQYNHYKGLPEHDDYSAQLSAVQDATIMAYTFQYEDIGGVKLNEY